MSYDYPVIVESDPELVMLEYLRTSLAARSETYLDGIECHARLPKQLPARCVWVREVTSFRRNVAVTQVNMTFDVFAETKRVRKQIGAMVEGLIYASEGKIAAGSVLYSPATISGPQDGPNPFASNETIVRLTMSVGVRRVQLG